MALALVIERKGLVVGSHLKGITVHQQCLYLAECRYSCEVQKYLSGKLILAKPRSWQGFLSISVAF